MATYAYTFNSGDTVTPTRINDARTISDIVNADIKSDAAIAGTKIAPAFGAQDITVSTANRSITNTGNFALSFGTNNTERVRITQDGILSLRPVGGEGGQLEIVNPDNATVGMFIDVSSADTARIFTASATTGDLQIGQLSGTGGITRFFTAGTERMRIDASGNVGIGTTTMSQRLNVEGSIHLGPGSGFRYISTTSEHLAFVKKAGGPFHFYFRKTDDGLVGGANSTDLFNIKDTGQVRFVPLSADPAGAETGDVYYNSSTNKLRVYNGSWVDLH